MNINTINTTPIAVYQMGKVGSETIVNSLKQLELAAPIYHVHILAHKNITISVNNSQKNNQPLNLQLKNSKILREYLDREIDPPLNIITAVREPISQFISAFFQNIESRNPDLINSSGNYKRQAIHNYLTKKLSNYDPKQAWNCNWFDRDFQPALGIDIYEHKFNSELGYTEFTHKNLNILVLQLENSKLWNQRISTFLNLSSPLKIVKTNVSNNKKYHRVYKNILANIELPISVLQEIYQCKYCQHFYSDEAIKGFIDKWSVHKTTVTN